MDLLLLSRRSAWLYHPLYLIIGDPLCLLCLVPGQFLRDP